MSRHNDTTAASAMLYICNSTQLADHTSCLTASCIRFSKYQLQRPIRGASKAMLRHHAPPCACTTPTSPYILMTAPAPREADVACVHTKKSCRDTASPAKQQTRVVVVSATPAATKTHSYFCTHMHRQIPTRTRQTCSPPSPAAQTHTQGLAHCLHSTTTYNMS